MKATELPIEAERQKIVQAIENNRVTIISGRTGCGKSTQVPKFILHHNPKSKIVVCEPRRIAATSLAARVCAELRQKLGDKVGYQIGMDSKVSESCQIIFITYGILIQQLLFNPEVPYTHIILDQVHERSLEMDFTFIALKKILELPQHKSIKLILMSATINSQQFASYFATHSKTRRFLVPTITYKTQAAGSKGKKKKNRRKVEELKVEILYDRKDFEDSERIDLPDKNRFTVREYFMDELKAPALPKYKKDSDIVITEDTYKFAFELVRKHLQKGVGDVMIFVPGIFEIKTLKKKLMKELGLPEESIVEVHSVYSEDLYQRLFGDKFANKVIIATNMGESSITLPLCRTVIDFCLTRKSITAKTKGYSRLETRLASKANLTQRSGRVGRVADGDVYRLISKQIFAELEEFDLPEIKFAALEMVILKAKQIDVTCRSKLFEDPYDVFLHAIDPPDVREIHCAIENLLAEGALVQQEPANLNPNKYEGSNLLMSEVGEFMVSMPCDLKISKMILFSMQFGAESTMIDIAAILITQRAFFQPEERREDIQEFMQSLVEYDGGYMNDFYLRQKIFEHWREQFFMKFVNKGRNMSEEAEEEEALHVVDDFCSDARIPKKQWDWCSQLGVSPFVMRDVLKNRENLRDKLQLNGFHIGRSYPPSNLIVLLCLCIACQDTTCRLEWKKPDQWEPRHNEDNYLTVVVNSEVISAQSLSRYLKPLPEPEYDLHNPKEIKVKGTASIYSKLLLPKSYTKNPGILRASPIFQYLNQDSKKGKVVRFSEEQPKIIGRTKGITICGESVNKFITRQNRKKQFLLLADRIFESKGRNYIGGCALVEQGQWVMMMLIAGKDVLLESHPSCEFYMRAIIQGQAYPLPFLLSNYDLMEIQELREIAVGQKVLKVSTGVRAKDMKLQDLFRNIPPLPPYEKWNFLFDQEIEQYRPEECQDLVEDASYAPQLYERSPSYFQRYWGWKKAFHEDQTYNLTVLTVEQCCLVCATCWPKSLNIIGLFHEFELETNLFRLRKSDGVNWVVDSGGICCNSKHKFGELTKTGKEAILAKKAICVYVPYEKVLPCSPEALRNLPALHKEGIKRLRKAQSSISHFECDICINIGEGGRVAKHKISQQNSSQQFFHRVRTHLYSEDHQRNMKGFLKLV